MKTAAKRVRLEEPLGISTNLNFNDFSAGIGDIGTDDLASMGEPEPDLVLLSSTSSSEDKTLEERIEDMMHAWDSLVRTVKNLAGSFCTLQRKQSLSTEATEERMGSLESMLGKCSDPEFEEECITVWDAFSFLLSGLEDNGKKMLTLPLKLRTPLFMKNLSLLRSLSRQPSPTSPDLFRSW